jgi:multicomponent Na+:H+ antiporter subunit D
MIDLHLTILVIITPLAAAPLCSLLPRHDLAWAWSTLTAATVFGLAVRLLHTVQQQGVQIYRLGGWQAPWGIELRIDDASALVIVLVSLIGLLVLCYAGRALVREIPQQRHPLFYTAYLLCLAGLLGMAATGDAFNLFVFLEISSLSAYALIAMGPDRRALLAAYRYLIMGSVGATFVLIGIGLLYMATGTLNMADLAQKLPQATASRTIVTAFGFLSVGFSLKMALFPLHAWLPNAYTYAPSTVTAFLAATATKVSIYAFARFAYSIIGSHKVFADLHADLLIVPLALSGIFIASAVAIFQTDLKRLLAYSSVAQVGYIALGLGLATEQGLRAGLLHLFNHGLMKGALFLVAGNIAWGLGSVRLADLRGLGRRMPLTSFAFILGGLNLIGVPLTAGFVSKWHLLLAVLDIGWWPVAALILAGSLLAVVYIWRVIEVIYFQAPPEGAPSCEAPILLQWPAWTLLAATLYLGCAPGALLDTATAAAKALMGTALMGATP